jgi:hypothetical protein
MPEPQDRAEANRLYWDTDAPVAEIANRLEISRRALYDTIQPRAIGLACVECGTDLVFRNRSAAERRQAECLTCEVQLLVEPIPEGATAAEPPVEQEAAAGRLSSLDRPAAPAEPAAHGAGLGAVLLAGLAVGAMAGYLLRQR